MDWEVRHISDEKALGLVVLRTLPEGSRIMVARPARTQPALPTVLAQLARDAVLLAFLWSPASDAAMSSGGSVDHVQVERGLRHPGDHPRVADLAPAGGTLVEKFRLNAMGDDSGGDVLCLRMSRANHACNNNAEHRFCEGVEVSCPPGSNHRSVWYKRSRIPRSFVGTRKIEDTRDLIILRGLVAGTPRPSGDRGW